MLKTHSLFPLNICANFEMNSSKIDDLEIALKRVIYFLWRHIIRDN